MQSKAIQKAESALRRAGDATASMRVAPSRSAFDDAWADFVNEIGKIHNRFEAGVKDDNRSKPWFGKIKYERRTDPLLRYLHHARDAEHHGLGDQIGHGIGIGAIGSIQIRSMTIDAEGMVTADWVPAAPGSQLKVTHERRLLVIRDRDGEHQPPTVHLGVPIADQTPLGVALLALQYYTVAIDHARKFAG